MNELRLVKVIVQPVFVLFDDQGGASEVVPQPMVVSAVEWPTFASGGFDAATLALRDEFARGADPS